MSDALAIEAVSKTLKGILIGAFRAQSDANGEPMAGGAEPGAEVVTTKPLDKARNGAGNGNGDGDGNGEQLNLYLYQTRINAALANMDPPLRVKPGETGYPALPLNLFYLVTAYGKDDDDLEGGHRLLGRAMSLLHDHPVLDRGEIEDALQDSDLSEQLERIRITPEPMSLDEMSKLWSSFQTQYRISVAYQVSAVLIDSRRPVKTPLPVLSRGPGDQGVNAIAEPGATLTEIKLPNKKQSAELNDTIFLRGTGLTDENVVVRFHHPLLKKNPIELKPSLMQIIVEGRPEAALQVKLLPAADSELQAQWPIGLYTVSIIVQKPGLPQWTSNALPMALAPTTTLTSPTDVPESDLEITLTCVPPTLPEQHVALLFGSRAIAVNPSANEDATEPRTELLFKVTHATEGTYVLRIRVDGVDSIPVDFSRAPPVFKDALTLNVYKPGP